MALFEKKDAAKPLPRHIAIIMDGNGRWAQKRGLPRTAGHAAGSETFRRIATYCKNLGLDYLTVYAFSTENWKRSADEVRAIMALFDKYLHEAIDEMEQDHIRLKILGDLGRISPSLRALIAKTDEISTHYDGFQANICVNYGGRDEIVHAARQFAQDCVGRQGPPGRSDRGNVRRLSLHGGDSRSGADHPPLGRDPDVELSALAVGVQ